MLLQLFPLRMITVSLEGHGIVASSFPPGQSLIIAQNNETLATLGALLNVAADVDCYFYLSTALVSRREEPPHLPAARGKG